MKRKTKARIARFTRQVPILRETQALRNESVLRLIVQAAFVGGCTGGVIGVFRWLYDHGNAWIAATLRYGADDPATALIVFGTLILLALIVGQMVRKEPLISGSGIPQTELALAGLLPYPGFRIVTAKFVGNPAVPVRRPLRGPRRAKHPDGRGCGLRIRADLPKARRRRSWAMPRVSSSRAASPALPPPSARRSRACCSPLRKSKPS